MFITLENALVTQSRYILLDPFLLLFGFSALLFYFRWRRTGRIPHLIGMAIFAGLSMSIKWTGVAFLGLAGINELVATGRTLSVRKIANLVLYFILIPLAIYFSFFAVHFSILSKTGEGDAFMTPAFQSSLQGSDYANDSKLKPLNVFQKFVELNLEMYKANQTLTATHPYSSKWYTWPFMIRPVYYWNHASTTAPTESKIYLIGNPLIWWASTVATLYLLFSSIGRGFFKNKTVLILLGGYFINYLPFIGIGRVMFLYHYLSALIFAVLTLAYLIDRQKFSKRMLLTAIAVTAISFIYFAPLSYGLPLEAGQFQNRIWLTTWQ
jgi:dolichyl-phosphate-mannose-protein mannosyltransferase